MFLLSFEIDSAGYCVLKFLRVFSAFGNCGCVLSALFVPIGLCKHNMLHGTVFR